MQIDAGMSVVITGAGSGIGRALAERYAEAGCDVVLADVDEAGMAETRASVEAKGVSAFVVPTDVSREDEVQALAAAAIDRFGPPAVVCNNAGVANRSESWTGPLAAWEWVMGVNFWGVVHGVRAFLPHLVLAGRGHIVNTASIAGLLPGFGAAYDASKHAVLAITEDLYHELKMTMLPIGVSVLCPGWVNTKILEAERNWPAELGARPEESPVFAVTGKYFAAALAEGLTPAAAADAVFDAVVADRFWVLPQKEWAELAFDRWDRIRSGADPEPPEEMPGLPPRSQMLAELLAAFGMVTESGD